MKTVKQLDRDIAAVTADYDWDAFIEGAAFGFWASPYVSEVENLAEDSNSARNKGDSKKADAFWKAYRALSPGAGGNWANVMPDVPASAKAVAKKFTKAVREKLTTAELAEVFDKFSAYDAGYYGAMQSQGEGVGWGDEGVRARPPTGFDYDTKIQNALYTAIRRLAREAGAPVPRSGG